MFFMILVIVGALFVASIGFSMIFSAPAQKKPDGSLYGADVLALAKKNSARTGKALMAVSVVILLVCGWWYLFVYSSPYRAGERDAKSLAANAELNEIKVQRVARGYVESALRDPGSAQFRNQSGICGEVNAKNSFGGYTGFKRFMAGSKDLVIIEGDGLSGADFQKAWDRVCM